MGRSCEICGKGHLVGNSIVRRGLAKKKGGVGQNITGITRRRFYPNLQNVKAIVAGTVKHIKVCAKCIKAGFVTKA